MIHSSRLKLCALTLVAAMRAREASRVLENISSDQGEYEGPQRDQDTDTLQATARCTACFWEDYIPPSTCADPGATSPFS